MTAPDPTVLDDLIARLEAANGPDRDLDRAIHVACGLSMGQVVHDGPAWWNAYTASVDAVLALTKATLPEWSLTLDVEVSGQCWARISGPELSDQDFSQYAENEKGSTVPLALCDVLLRALRQEADYAR